MTGGRVWRPAVSAGQVVDGLCATCRPLGPVVARRGRCTVGQPRVSCHLRRRTSLPGAAPPPPALRDLTVRGMTML